MNEREYIRSLAVQSTCPDILRGMGDDCAVIGKGSGLVQLLSLDTMVEGVHFDRSFHPPDLLGRKLVSVNVSDIAAMGGRPTLLLLSSGLPPGFDEAWVLTFNRGLHAACRDYGCTLVGGDTVASPGGFCFSLTILGEMAAGEVLYRSGAQQGDTLYVSGNLGFAAAGLALLQADRAGCAPDFAPLVDRHLNPEARVALGQQLAASGLVHAMMDSSDGPASDVAQLCAASGLGARIFADRLPASNILTEAARLLDANPQDWMLKGGEDFELLFTAAPEHDTALRAIARKCGLRLTPIGCMDAGAGLRLVAGDGRDSPLDYQGYEHFCEPGL